jgi:hypothetical protein
MDRMHIHHQVSRLAACAPQMAPSRHMPTIDGYFPVSRRGKKIGLDRGADACDPKCRWSWPQNGHHQPGQSINNRCSVEEGDMTHTILPVFLSIKIVMSRPQPSGRRNTSSRNSIGCKPSSAGDLYMGVTVFFPRLPAFWGKRY